MHEKLAPVKFGLLLGLLTLVYGFGLGATFGAKEDAIKGHLKEEALAVLDDKYDGDEAKAKKVYDKAWVYFKRAHLHANGLGTATLAVALLLAHLAGAERRRMIGALLMGLGALGYSSYWMFAGLRAPGMGSTGAAKESLAWLAIPTSAACIVGLLIALVLFARAAFLGRDR